MCIVLLICISLFFVLTLTSLIHIHYSCFNHIYCLVCHSSRTAELLMVESGCRLDHPAAAKFRQHVMDADWTKADHDLQELKPLLENSQNLTVIP